MSGDSLVLRIGDRMDRRDKKDDTVIYIICDHYENKWVIRGKRYNEFSFYCDDKDDVSKFLDLIYNNFYRITYTLCSYPDLPLSSDEITYELLENEYYDKKISIYDTYSNGKSISNSAHYNEYLDVLESMYNNYHNN